MRSCVSDPVLAGRGSGGWSEYGPLAAGEELILPRDLREWVPADTLLGWIADEVEHLHWDVAGCADCFQRVPNCNPRSLLSVLALAYATELLDSEDVIHACYQEPAYRSLCAGKIPSTEELSCFRRRNRGLLITLLARLLARAVREKLGTSNVALPVAAKRRLHENSVTRLDTARHLDRAEL